MSNIEWTDETWNPVTGCTKISPGCDNCYAEKIALRFKHNFPKGFNVDLKPERLTQPDKWRKPRRIFVNSMSDLFHPEVPFNFVDDVLATMNRNQRHDFQVLTKRPKTALHYFQTRRETPLTAIATGHGIGRKTFNYPSIPFNLWIGTSVEDVPRLIERLLPLLTIPADVHFLSVEPLLEDISSSLTAALRTIHENTDLPMLDWIIVGGESGPGAREMRADWVRNIRQICAQFGIKFFFKQWGGRNKTEAGRELDGNFYDAFPRRHPRIRHSSALGSRRLPLAKRVIVDELPLFES